MRKMVIALRVLLLGVFVWAAGMLTASATDVWVDHWNSENLDIYVMDDTISYGTRGDTRWFDVSTKMVKNGQVDATINASTSFGDYMKSNPDDPLEVAATTPEATKYAIPLEKGKQNDSLRKAINKAIKEMRDDGTLKELSVRYFGSDLTNE